MGLESTMICVDNSDWMRNGDFRPTRFDSQNDAVYRLCSSKLNSNAESSIGLMTTAEKRAVLVTLGREKGRVLSSMHSVRLGGSVDLLGSIQIAQLALKHRPSKNHRQRIVVFVGSPIVHEEPELKKLAKKLKKNGISVDIVNFGETEDNQTKLEMFIETVNKDDSSHLVTVPAGTSLTDALATSPILDDGSGMGGGGGGGGGGGDMGGFGFDPNDDPELALALRVSMEEERARQAAQQDGNAPAEEGAAPMETGDDDEDLRAALALSQQQMTTASTEAESNSAAQPAVNYEDLDDDAQMQMALQMSLAQSQEEPEAATPMETDEPAAKQAEQQPKKEAEAEKTDVGGALSDPAFLASVLGGLPGVDPNDPQIQDVLSGMQDRKKDEKKDGDKK